MRQDQVILGVAGAMFVIIFAGRLSVNVASDFQGLPLIMPIALVAMEFGRRGGIVAAGVSGLIIISTSFLGGPAFDPGPFLLPMVCFIAIAVIIGDLSERRRRLDEENSRWFSLSNDMLATASLDGWFTRLNPAWERTLGYTLDELMSRPYSEFVHPDDREPTVTVSEALSKGEETTDFENRFKAKDGEWHWLLWSARSDGKQVYGVAKDITDRKALEAERERQLIDAEGIARTDPLTGLANRRAWDEEFSRELERQRRRESALAILMIDLDDFKTLNDTEGHLAGDALLKELSLNWRVVLRTNDVAARLGGDEFGLLLPDCAPDFAEALFDRLQGVSPAKAEWSAGIAYWEYPETPESMTKRADEALYSAKSLGGNQSVTAAPASLTQGKSRI